MLSEPVPELSLNPLAFPVETDMRFLLLVIGAVGATLGLADYAGAMLAGNLPFDQTSAQQVGTVVALVFTLCVVAVAHRRAARAADALIARERWTAFPPRSGDALAQASLEYMGAHIDRLVCGLPGLPAHAPQFYWNDTSSDRQRPAGMAFGYRGNTYVCLNQGLHAAFLSTPRAELFHGVLLHELGHIANRDIGRTMFSIELGRAFTQASLALLAVISGCILVNSMQPDTTNQYTGHSAVVLGQIATSTLLAIALVEILRAGVLRAREYYADAQARQWLGSAAPLIELFGRQAERRSNATPKPALIRLRERLAPLHPSHQMRVDALTNPFVFFEVDLWIVVIAGFLCGFGLDAASIVLAAPLYIASWLMSRSAGLLLPIAVLGLVLSGIFLIVLFLAPLVGTIGAMVQRAAFADAVAGRPLTLRFSRLVGIALLAGGGVVLGGAYTPTFGILTLDNSSWSVVPVLVLGWTGMLMLWLLPLRWLAARAYRSHIGSQPPRFRRRCVALLASAAIAPLLGATALEHAALAKATLVSLAPDQQSMLQLLIWTSIPVSLIIWVAGAVLMWRAGWFGHARCSACLQIADQTRAIGLRCAGCGQPLRPWAVEPPPINIPTPVPLATQPGDLPPPL